MKPDFMQQAITLAKTTKQDVPIAAIIVKDNKIIAKAVNEREKKRNATLHAEIVAINEASKVLNNWHLDNCEIYVTLEPCPMCASAILQARIKKIYFGAYDYLYGAFGTKCDMRKIMNYSADVKGGILEEECTKILKDYFEEIRNV
jgi:tRNA(adenine34) deaminase